MVSDGRFHILGHTDGHTQRTVKSGLGSRG